MPNFTPRFRREQETGELSCRLGNFISYYEDYSDTMSVDEWKEVLMEQADAAAEDYVDYMRDNSYD